MRLIHYSDAPLTSVLDAEQSGEKYDWHDGQKPHGLWVSVEGPDDWASWCTSERFRNTEEQHATLVMLRDDHKVLLLDTSDAMKRFHAKYRYRSNRSAAWKPWRIDWPAVAEDSDGVIIAPYQWDHRLDGELSSWYCSWDCASGCIWRARAVQSLAPIAKLATV